MASVARLVLEESALSSATNNGTKKSLPSKAKSFIGWLNVSACNAATTVSSKIQHSPDGTNWIDLVSFTNVVGTTGVEQKFESAFTGAGLLFPNVRSVVTLAGATKSATVLVALYFEEDK